MSAIFDQHQLALNISVSLPAFLNVYFKQPDIFENRTGIWGLIVLNNKCGCYSNFQIS